MGTPKHIFLVVEWFSQTPVMGVCDGCGWEFKAPMTALSTTKDAQANLQQQVDSPNCKQSLIRPFDLDFSLLASASNDFLLL